MRDEAYYQESEIFLGDDNNHYGPQGTVVEWVEEDSYFFRLSAYQESLLSLYNEKPDFIAPSERRNEIMAFVRSGLKDISISRSRKNLNWGIRVPNDPDHIMYVWVDALSNYLTATGVLEKEGNPRSSFWPANLQIIGKDIIRFHAVYWPAFLMSAGLSMPDRIFSHGFILNKGEKMSKSLGNVMDPVDLAERFGVDCLRYFFLREVSFGQDGSYNAENIITRMNADLANGIGNLTSRSLSMIFKHCDARIPEYQTLIPVDQTMLSSGDNLGKTVRDHMNAQEIHRALEKIMAVVSETDRYFAAQQPWALKTTDPVRMATVLYVTAEVIRQIALLLLPFIPASAGKILDFLSVPHSARFFSFLGEQGRLVPGMAVEMPWSVFPRYNA
ncbi:Methionyl-tRNA synthetase [Liberibacter crescens BT-1]|uniref:methionine--tRNA ligase n=1 Tax=Liberibacter crescens (strain BT-1) TaxID=1215343 RepID=L0EV03_LIBCB|nr:Methionyl-tRNA synthetase [Liberibacter crescens BT-1]